MHVSNQMVSGTTLQTNMASTQTVEIPLDITAQELSKTICRMAGIYDASKKRGFTDCSTEMHLLCGLYRTRTTQESSILELTINYPCFF